MLPLFSRARVLARWAALYRSDRRAARLIQRVLRDRLSYLGSSALIDLHEQVANAEQQGRAGILIEAGCALGGSALVMTAAKGATRPFFIYDVFGMIPPPSEADGSDAHQRYQTIASGQSEGIKGARYYGYESKLLEQVKQNFERYGMPPQANQLHFVQGLYQDTLRPEQPVALAHIDCDWYDSVLTCLQRIEPHLVEGGVLVIDDYYDWSGCRAAVDDYFAGREKEFSFEKKARLHITRHPTTNPS